MIEAALAHFWRKGARTTTRDLERVLGLTQSSIYNAFGSKHGLLEEALDRYELKTDRALLDPLRASEDGLAGIEEFFLDLKGWVACKQRRGCMLTNLIAEDGGETASIVARAARYRKRVRAALVAALRRAAEAGHTRAENIEGRADLLMGLVLGFSVAARGGAAPAELRRLLDAALAQCRSWRLTRSA